MKGHPCGRPFGVGAPLQAPPGWEHPCGHPRVGTDTEVPVPGFGQKLVLTLRPAFPILLRLAVLSSVGWAGFGRHRKHTENIHKILSVPGLELTHYYTIAQRLNHYTTVPPLFIIIIIIIIFLITFLTI